MVINGIEFDFNPLNASHLERLDAASEAYRKAEDETEKRVENTLSSRAAQLRAGCQHIAQFCDAVLGEGSAEKLGVPEEDMGGALEVLENMSAAIIAEQKHQNQQHKNRSQPQQNQQQRRKTKRRR